MFNTARHLVTKIKTGRIRQSARHFAPQSTPYSTSLHSTPQSARHSTRNSFQPRFARLFTKLSTNWLSANSGFSLMEVLIVVTMLAVLLLVGLAVYRKQLSKARDGKRKSDLEELTTAMEDFYNDRGCYPLPTEICYDADDDSVATCHICGQEADPFPNYHLPCNPEHPEKQYLYEPNDDTCPQWYRIYTELANVKEETLCPYSLCGPVGGYDYGVSSPNVDLEFGGDNLVGYEVSNATCIHCGDLEQCEQYLADGSISNIYVSEDHCCAENGNADNCVFYGWHQDELDCTACIGSLNDCGPVMDIYRDDEEATWLEQCCSDHPGADACN